MIITADIFAAYLKCPSKCWFRFRGEKAPGNTYSLWVEKQSHLHRKEALKRILNNIGGIDLASSTDQPLNIKTVNWRLGVCRTDSMIHGIIGAMEKYINVDRDTPMLLPADLREWIAEDDMVHFVIGAIEGMRIERFKVNHRGTGNAQYPPRMMLALLIYCYANGIFGSRRIERATYRDIAVRYLTGNTHPDHDTIAKFRREPFEAVAECFIKEDSR